MTNATHIPSRAKILCAAAALQLAALPAASSAQSEIANTHTGSFASIIPAALGDPNRRWGALYGHDSGNDRNNFGLYADWRRARLLVATGRFGYDRASRVMAGLSFGSVLLGSHQGSASAATAARLGIQGDIGGGTDTDRDGFEWSAGISLPLCVSTAVARITVTPYLAPGVAVGASIIPTAAVATLNGGVRLAFPGSWAVEAGARRALSSDRSSDEKTLFGLGVSMNRQ